MKISFLKTCCIFCISIGVLVIVPDMSLKSKLLCCVSATPHIWCYVVGGVDVSRSNPLHSSYWVTPPHVFMLPLALCQFCIEKVEAPVQCTNWNWSGPVRSRVQKTTPTFRVFLSRSSNSGVSLGLICLSWLFAQNPGKSPERQGFVPKQKYTSKWIFTLFCCVFNFSMFVFIFQKNNFKTFCPKIWVALS